jgi:hypothetical protein
MGVTIERSGCAVSGRVGRTPDVTDAKVGRVSDRVISK